MATSGSISTGATRIDPNTLPNVNDLYQNNTLTPSDQRTLAQPSRPLNALVSIYRSSDIANLQTDAIVSATTTLPPLPSPPGIPQPHPGIVHAAGPDIVPEFTSLASRGRYDPGFPILTTGHALQARWVVHPWAPRAPENIMAAQQPWHELALCYIKAMELGRQRGWKTMAFLTLCSDGGDESREGLFPTDHAAMMACRQVRRFLQFNPDAPFERIVFVIKDDVDYEHYCHWLPLLFPAAGENTQSAGGNRRNRRNRRDKGNNGNKGDGSSDNGSRHSDP